MLGFILIVAMLNGLGSPALQIIFAHAPLWMPGFLPVNLQVVLYASSLLCSTLTLLIAGIPAAIYERVTGATHSTDTSLLIWGGGTVLLTLPAMGNLAKLI